jgi:hypothetical protein
MEFTMQKFVVQKIEITADQQAVFMQDAFMSDTNDAEQVAKLADAIWGRTNYMGFVVRDVAELQTA